MVAHLLASSVPYAVTSGRAVGTAAALIALAGLVYGAVLLARRGRGARRGGALAVVGAGIAGTIAGALVVAVADGGPGTGNGVVGGWAAVVFGLVAVALGILALRAVASN